MTMDSQDDVKLFQSIGLSEQKAKETLKNKQVSNNLKLAIIEVSKLYIQNIFLITFFII